MTAVLGDRRSVHAGRAADTCKRGVFFSQVGAKWAEETILCGPQLTETGCADLPFQTVLEVNHYVPTNETRGTLGNPAVKKD
jgi:hypothetical protein